MRILIVDEEESSRQATVALLEGTGYQAAGAGQEAAALELVAEVHFDLALLDLERSGSSGWELIPKLLDASPLLDIMVLTSPEQVETARDALRRGASHFLIKPVSSDQMALVLGERARMGQLARRASKLQSHLSLLMAAPSDWSSEDSRMAGFFEQAWAAAATTAPLLLGGECGAGKTLLAGAIHDHSPRQDHVYCRMDCRGVSPEMLERELFGDVGRPRADGEMTKWGQVVQAGGGTLFLDHVGGLPMDLQWKLIRLLRDNEYERGGEGKTRKNQARVVMALDYPLQQALRADHPPEGLLSLPNVISLHLPPLRERRADLPRLAAGFAKFFARQCGKPVNGLSLEALEAMSRYSWPVNLRELRNVMEQAVMLSGGGLIQLDDLPARVQQAVTGGDGKSLQVGSRVSLEELESEHIRKLIQQTSTMEEAARILGIDPATLYRKRKRWAQQHAAETGRIAPIGT